MLECQKYLSYRFTLKTYPIWNIIFVPLFPTILQLTELGVVLQASSDPSDFTELAELQ